MEKCTSMIMGKYQRLYFESGKSALKEKKMHCEQKKMSQKVKQAKKGPMKVRRQNVFVVMPHSIA